MVTNSELSDPEHASALAANQFQRIGILLLRHQARSAGDAVAQFQPAELFARIKNPVFGQPAQVQHRGRCRIQKIEREIAIRRNVHAVARDRGETQIARDGLAVERKSAARQRSAAQRHHVDPRASLLQPLEIPREHFEIRQQIMRPQHRLRAPQMRVAGNHRVGISSARTPAAPASVRPAAPPRDRFRRAATSRTSSDTCSLRLRPVWILSASSAHAFLQFANHQRVHVFVGRAVEELRRRGILRGSRRTPPPARPAPPPSGCSRLPALARTPASRGYPHRSAAGRKCSDPENRSKTSDGPSSNRPPHSFIRTSSWTSWPLSSRPPAPESAGRSG